MIASLPMYDWPEVRADVNAFYADIRTRVPALPAALTRGRDAGAVWRDPALAVSQTCWGPLRHGLLAHLRVLAQPDYSDVPGGQGPFYRSALVARAGSAMSVPTHSGPRLPELAGRFAFNGRDSLSGWLALAADAGDPADWASAVVETGSHRASLQAVAHGRADLAAIDCRSWALAQKHEPAAAGLVVVGWTALRPGLPYVTARTTEPGLTRKLRAALLDMGCHPATEGL
jgi:ABC-type phosphate/phosphonate transport system substrate-binding protein